jgi:hypothetical protein
MMTPQQAEAFEHNELARKIVEILAPVVGSIVAHAMVEKQCKVIGVTTATLEKKNLDDLCKRIEHIFAIFGHDEKEVITKINALK